MAGEETPRGEGFQSAVIAFREVREPLDGAVAVLCIGRHDVEDRQQAQWQLGASPLGGDFAEVDGDGVAVERHGDHAGRKGRDGRRVGVCAAQHLVDRHGVGHGVRDAAEVVAAVGQVCDSGCHAHREPSGTRLADRLDVGGEGEIGDVDHCDVAAHAEHLLGVP